MANNKCRHKLMLIGPFGQTSSLNSALSHSLIEQTVPFFFSDEHHKWNKLFLFDSLECHWFCIVLHGSWSGYNLGYNLCKQVVTQVIR